MSDDPDYEVGYRRPPLHTRFKPGASGNPRGRPKGAKNLKTDLAEELAERIPVREGERTRKIPKQRALMKALLAKGLKGDTRAASLVLSLIVKLEGPEPAGAESEPLSDEDFEILQEFLSRAAAKRRVPPSDQSR